MIGKIKVGFEAIHECIRITLIGKEKSYGDTKV